ncbi:hypothetical protein RND81_12G018200 [Saponaria officinalis]|uniref:3'-5' exonuclease domain-containing protein n=1 Tax=Saponaria officinalis TaxID=3572 RepID=A0AAW1H2B1_SAPOF
MVEPHKATVVKQYNTNTTTTYNVTYLDHKIVTTVTKSPTEVTSWITDIKSIHHQPTIVGLDTESQKPVSTLQLCVSHNCLIYQLTHSPEIPSSLREFLGDPNWVFSGVGVGSDVKLLAKDYDLVVANKVDVSRVAAEMKKVRVNAGLKEVAKTVLGWEVEKCKEITMSQWGNEVLDDAQVMYACLDAFVSYQLAKELSNCPGFDDNELKRVSFRNKL